jgi:hypothetical protein
MSSINTITLELPALAVMLWGDERLDTLRPLSTKDGDTAKVFVRPFSLGQLIKMQDPEENYFHVELITDVDPLRAEIWLTREWKISNAREQRFRNREAERNKQYDTATRRTQEIMELMKKSRLSGCPEEYLQELALTILKNYKKKDFSQIFAAIDLAETLAKYEQEDTGSKS